MFKFIARWAQPGSLDSQGSSAAQRDAYFDATTRSFAVFECDPSGGVVSANDRLAELTGYSKSELENMQHSQLVGSETSQSASFEDLWARLGRGETVELELEYSAKGGESRWFEGRYAALTDASGRVVRILGFLWDTSARKQAEQQAWAAVAEIEGVSAASARIEFDPSGVILGINENFQEVMGYLPSEVVGQHHRIFMDPAEAASPDYAQFWQDLAHGIPKSGEFKRKTKAGETVWLSGRYSALKDRDGEVFKVVKYATDITAKKEAEEDNEKLHRELVACAEELRVSASELISNAEASASSSSLTLQQAKDVNQNSTVVAGSTEQMTASIQDISNSTLELSQSLQRAAKAAIESAQRMDILRQANEEISRVSETIADIADQTNLLALNATIEAAGAGDAGRGFAVVASEVKDLARETMQATESIKGQVRDVTARSEDVAKAVDEINSVIEQVALLSTSLSSAVEEQSMTTREISSAIGDVAGGADEIAGQMEEVARAAATSNHTAQGVLEAAEQLRNLSQALSTHD